MNPSLNTSKLLVRDVYDLMSHTQQPNYVINGVLCHKRVMPSNIYISCRACITACAVVFTLAFVSCVYKS